MKTGMQQEYGTANAVYSFLQEQLGVRWLWPGEEDVDPARAHRHRADGAAVSSADSRARRDVARSSRSGDNKEDAGRTVGAVSARAARFDGHERRAWLRPLVGEVWQGASRILRRCARRQPQAGGVEPAATPSSARRTPQSGSSGSRKSRSSSAENPAAARLQCLAQRRLHLRPLRLRELPRLGSSRWRKGGVDLRRRREVPGRVADRPRRAFRQHARADAEGAFPRPRAVRAAQRVRSRPQPAHRHRAGRQRHHLQRGELPPALARGSQARRCNSTPAGRKGRSISCGGPISAARPA